MEKKIEDVVKPRPLSEGLTLTDYWQAPGGLGPLAAEWEDKPHRLLYDLIAALVKAGTEPLR